MSSSCDIHDLDVPLGVICPLCHLEAHGRIAIDKRIKNKAGELIADLYQLMGASLSGYDEIPGYTDDDVTKLMDRCCESMKELEEKVIPIPNMKSNAGGSLFDDCPKCGGVLKMTWIEGEDVPKMCKQCEGDQ